MSLSTPPMPRSRRPSLKIPADSHSPSPSSRALPYFDSREHGYQGPTRSVRLSRASTPGGGVIAKSEDGVRCVVAGKSSLRILRVSDTPHSLTPDHRSAVGRGGHRIDASRNYWAAAGFKVESVTTDAVWGRGNFDHKVLTSARNGDLLMWDLNKLGVSKYEKRARDHFRSINRLALSPVVPYYCLTGSSDGDLRIWDIRTFDKSLIRIHHVQAVRAAAFSPSTTNPLQAIVGLDNGSIYRWDLKMGHKGQLDRITVAHSGAVLSLDWCSSSSSSDGPSHQGLQRQDTLTSTDLGGTNNASGTGWIASAGMDRTVKVWDLNSAGHTAHMSSTPSYTLSAPYPVRHARWRPGYECELALVSNAGFGGLGQERDSGASETGGTVTPDVGVGVGGGGGGAISSSPEIEITAGREERRAAESGFGSDPVEIWDVRRGWLAKWVLPGSTIEGGVTDIAFRDSHALWAQHTSGAFSQLDLRHAYRPIDGVPRSSASWDAAGTLTFVADDSPYFEPPYDDLDPATAQNRLERGLRTKALGDAVYKPAHQGLGSVGLDSHPERIAVFERLAKSYIFDGADKHAICGHNARVASEVGELDAAQIWAFAQSQFDPLPPPADPVPDEPPLSALPTSLTSPTLPHSHSAPAAIPTVNDISSPTTYPSRRATTLNSYSEVPSTPGPSSSASVSALASTSSSPQRSSTPLSSLAISPSPSSNFSSLSAAPSRGPGQGQMPFPLTRRPSVFGPNRPRALSSLSRPSVTPSVASGSGGGSLKHVGEGALDDSDSEGEGSADIEDERSERAGSSAAGDERSGSGGGGGGKRRMISPTSPLFGRSASMASQPSPSPLSRIAGQSQSQHRWAGDDEEDEGEGEEGEEEGEEEGDTPSPASTSESDEDDASPAGSVRLVAASSSGVGAGAGRGGGGRAGKSLSRSRVRVRSRSRKAHRTSTSKSQSKSKSRNRMSSLAIPLTPLAREGVGSASSLQTILGGAESPVGSMLSGVRTARPGASVRDTDGSVSVRSQRVASGGTGQGVEPLSPESHHNRTLDDDGLTNAHEESPDVSEEVERRRERMRERCWDVLRETLERLIEGGDVQMGCMLALVCGAEMGLGRRRVVRLVEGYLEVLARLGLHTTVAYIRQYAPDADVEDATKAGTTVYISCGRCSKAIPLEFGTTCAECRAPTLKCSICRLPVKSLGFTCAICAHGGHSACYRHYYSLKPPHQLPRASSPPPPEEPGHRGRSLSRLSGTTVPDTPDLRGDERGGSGVGLGLGLGLGGGGGGEKRALVGHACAAGCGHFCWVSNVVEVYA
ncbi:unnamed protein product [Peniophora sp. CBMAI 1063]|nr:unnamed protein product [Peniophora sp. CBMAI 1063]